MGLRVFPVDRATGDPREQGGLQAATSDPDQVFEMWRRLPRANVGLATGPNASGTGFDVVHIAGGVHGGARLASQLNDGGVLDGWAMVAEHPGGGLDIYYPADGWAQPSIAMGDGQVKLHSYGSWVLAPGSVAVGDDGQAGRIVVTHRASGGSASPVNGFALRARVDQWCAVSADPQDPRAGRVLGVTQAAWARWAEQLDGSWGAGYARSRQASLEGLGFAPASPRDGLVRYLTGSGWLLAEIEAAGLARAGRDGRMVDRIRDRLLFAFRDDLGRVVGVTGRARPDAPEGVPKYLNTPRTAIFHKSRAMLGWGPEAVGRLGGGGVPVLVEGPFDVLAVEAAARAGGRADIVPLAASGTAWTGQHVALIRQAARCGPSGRPLRVVFALDGDDAGQAAILKAAEHLTPTEQGLARVVELASDADPASVLEGDGPDVVLDLIAGARTFPVMMVDALCPAFDPELSAAFRVPYWHDVIERAATLDRYGASLARERLDQLLRPWGEHDIILGEFDRRAGAGFPARPQSGGFAAVDVPSAGLTPPRAFPFTTPTQASATPSIA
ncbi:MAG: bifunctional DNA primase/polymerase [Micrococcales bacterium]|nr:bifunctional DNA primase/polymerase [Micrococcales bacterium]